MNTEANVDLSTAAQQSEAQAPLTSDEWRKLWTDYAEAKDELWDAVDARDEAEQRERAADKRIKELEAQILSEPSDCLEGIAAKLGLWRADMMMDLKVHDDLKDFTTMACAAAYFQIFKLTGLRRVIDGSAPDEVIEDDLRMRIEKYKTRGTI